MDELTPTHRNKPDRFVFFMIGFLTGGFTGILAQLWAEGRIKL